MLVLRLVSEAILNLTVVNQGQEIVGWNAITVLSLAT